MADDLSQSEMNTLLSGQPPLVDSATMTQAQVTDTQIQDLLLHLL